MLRTSPGTRGRGRGNRAGRRPRGGRRRSRRSQLGHPPGDEDHQREHRDRGGDEGQIGHRELLMKRVERNRPTGRRSPDNPLFVTASARLDGPHTGAGEPLTAPIRRDATGCQERVKSGAAAVWMAPRALVFPAVPRRRCPHFVPRRNQRRWPCTGENRARRPRRAHQPRRYGYAYRSGGGRGSRGRARRSRPIPARGRRPRRGTGTG